MPSLRILPALLFPFVVGCSASTNDMTIELAPDVVSSIDGTLNVRATAFAERAPAANQAIELTVAYTDRNGTAHTIAPIDGKTNGDGVFTATVEGLKFDGTGTVTATLQPAGKITADATFSVLDRTPPTLTILPPANNQIHITTDNTIQVHVTDEIGVSEVILEAANFNNNGGGNNNNNRQRSTVVASGATDATVSFDLGQAQDASLGATVTLYAIASDLSGNQAAAMPITATVVQ